MTWQAWLTLVVIVAIVVVLVRDLLSPAAAMGSGAVVLLAAGVITPAQALSGFANPAPATIAALYIVAAAISKTGALAPLVRGVLGEDRGTRSVLLRLTTPTVAASSFMNNTPIVAMLTPQVERWARVRGRSPSKFLMPLSFAAILGGVVTLMGTATNIVVSGLLESDGFAPFGFFEISRIGLPIALVGIATIVLLAPKVLPERRSPSVADDEEFRQFNMTMRVLPDIDGQTVGAAGLRHLSGVFLAQVERSGELITPVGHDTVLRTDDVLRFVGRVDQVVDLESMPGLVSTEDSQVAMLDAQQVTHYEAVVGTSSPLVGVTLRDTGFRSRYQAVVTAIHRAGQRIDAKLGDVVLQVGDTLVVIGDRDWSRRWKERSDFALIATLDAAPPVAGRRAAFTTLIVAGMVILAATGVVPLITAALLGAAAFVATRTVTPSEARTAVDFDVIITIAAAFGVAAGLHSSGLAETTAKGLIGVLGGIGGVGALAGVIIATVLLKEIITNNAAALMILPLALATAAELGLNPRTFAFGVAVAAATPFLTPIGYQTNLMVYGPGGYRFTDYLRLGIPLTVVVIVMLIVGLPILWPL
ncbi:MAG: SLC13 family permease [Acidimicrobiia bacterium]